MKNTFIAIIASTFLFSCKSETKTEETATVPTAENMAAEAFKILKAQYQDIYGNHLNLERVRLYETPNSWADALA